MSFNTLELDRIIEMAWEDRTTFEAIEHQFKITEQEVIKLMRTYMKPKSLKTYPMPRNLTSIVPSFLD